MKCKDCAMFDNRKDPDGNFICDLCSGTYVSPKEKESTVCKYTGQLITDEYASKKFWRLPLDCFELKIGEIKEIMDFSQNAMRTNNRLRQKLAGILYSQLATALEVYLKEQFHLGMESPKAFDNFINGYHWRSKYYPSEIHGKIKDIVTVETDRMNFQNFDQAGIAYNVAFRVNILGFPRVLKREITRILRYRHSLVHNDEVWENGKFVKIDFPQIRKDIATARGFISRIDEDFEHNIGSPSELWVEKIRPETITDDRKIDTCEKCPLGMKFDSENIICFEGAYDGIGFGMKTSEWKNPPCGDMTFQEAMRQRKLIGEKALFGHLCLIPSKEEEKETNSPKKSNTKEQKTKRQQKREKQTH